jgi:hypothetical protein
MNAHAPTDVTAAATPATTELLLGDPGDEWGWLSGSMTRAREYRIYIMPETSL